MKINKKLLPSVRERWFYLENHDIVQVVINRWDPINLFPGAPDNEYSVEVRKITNALGSISSAKELAKAIQDIFKHAFNQEIDYIKCLTVASEIWLASKRN